jgi:hypothetical protein
LWHLNMFWGHVMHVLDMLWVLGKRNTVCHWACYVSFGTLIKWEDMSAKRSGVSPNLFLENMNELLYFPSVQVENLFFITNFST